MQALFLRELLAVFQGNELVVGIMLAHSWFALSLGIYISSKIKKMSNSNNAAAVFSALTGALFILSFLFIINIRNFLHIPLGGGISLKTTFIYAFQVVFPPFFAQGAAIFSAVKSKRNKDGIQTSLTLLCSGFVIGGVCYSAVIYAISGLSAALIIAAVLCAGSVIAADTKITAKVFFFLALIPVLFGLFVNIDDMEKKFLQGSFGSSEIVEHKYTSYGQTALVQKNKEYSLLVNNVILLSSPDNDVLNSEDFGHIPMLYPVYPRNILIIGGAAKYLPMILTHKVERVDYLEPDNAVVEIMKQGAVNLGYVFNDKRVHVYNENARDFLKKSDRRYDLILVGMPTPVNLKLNGFYTKEFFQTVKKRMRSNGFIAVNLPGTMAFSTYIMAELNQSVMEAMKSVFKNTAIIPGSRNILIASDRKMPYRLHIKKRLYKMQETTLVLSKYYLDERMDTERTRWLSNELNKIENDSSLINTDWNPQAMLLSVLHSQSAFSPYLSLFADKARKYLYFIFIIVIIIFFLSKSIYGTTAFVSGAASAWIFITLLFAAQILSGELYKIYGLLSALFVLGILAGLVYSYKTKNTAPLNKKMFYSELLFLILIIFLLPIFKFCGITIHTIYVFLFGAGFAAGTEFVQLIRISGLVNEGSKDNLKIYLANMSGAVFSALTGGCFFIIAWGMEKSLLFILFMKFLIFCRWADFKKRGL
ncbi:MAG: hypothetical protein FWG57_00040 [Endomicrobia bacterium]|nr:hypothetical protein [Endomicrobiia bacterium]